MRAIDKSVLKKCRIYGMLKRSGKHLSFHTPGHKTGKWDITELSFSDNLSSPTGVLKEAEEDIAEILGAYKSFILVDGSTSGVLSMIKASGAKSVLMARDSHKSAYNAAALMGIRLKIVENRREGGISLPLSAREIEENVSGCEAVLITYPDYYGNLSPLKEIRDVCDKYGAVLLVDGAHGAAFKGTDKHCGRYADMWVDGAHKSLPCLTQGAAVSCKDEKFALPLKRAVDIFRTTSPNYILMASVEYAFKFPRNEELERAAEAFKSECGAYKNGDWTKAVFHYGDSASRIEKSLEDKGIYSEFCDGKNIMFYFSPCTKKRDIARLKQALRRFKTEPISTAEKKAAAISLRCGATELVPLTESKGRVCAEIAGIFPPCVPLVSDGEIISEEHIKKLAAAKNTFGVDGQKIKVYKQTGEFNANGG